MYEILNRNAKKYLKEQISLKCIDKTLLKRCNEEINLLYKNNLLFIFEYLYKYKEKNGTVTYHFEGTTNNLLFLFILGLNSVNPIESNLSYESFSMKTIEVDLIDGKSMDLVKYFHKDVVDIKIVKGTFEEENNEIIKKIENHYLLIPLYCFSYDMYIKNNKDKLYETTVDYRRFEDKIISIKICEK